MSLHEAIAKRVAREPLAIARQLAQRYPETPAISYIPSVAWVNTLRLAALTGDDTLRTKVREQTRPWVSGEKALFGDRIQLTAIAGTMIFADLAAAGDTSAQALAARGAELARAKKADGVLEYGGGSSTPVACSGPMVCSTTRSTGPLRGDAATASQPSASPRH